jgi:hypothetical protein
MTDEKTLDEALEEIDRWSEQMLKDIQALAPEQLVEYFKKAESRLEQQTGRRLDLPFQPVGAAIQKVAHKVGNALEE